MKSAFFHKILINVLLFVVVIYMGCTKLDVPVYERVQNENFWNTPSQVAAGLAPAYSPLRGYFTNDMLFLNEPVAFESVIIARGTDWRGTDVQPQCLHQFLNTNPSFNNMWNSIFSGITQCNFELNVVNNLTNKPSNIEAINAELKILRAYYYLQALDNFGNVPLVTSFDADPATITNNDPNQKKKVFDFIESDLKANIPLANTNVDATTYGRATKWLGFSVLANLYLNAQVYTGTARWADCASACDSVLLSGKYSLTPGYFDNFSPTNDWTNKENIFVAPCDNKYIGGNSMELFYLNSLSASTFGLTGASYNGPGTDGDYYYGNFDTSSVYTNSGGNVYRTFKDQRTGQFAVGPQFKVLYPYPQDKNILISSNTVSDAIFDGGAPFSYEPNVDSLFYANSTPASRGKGARKIKYFPQNGTNGNQSNDLVVYRLAAIILMRAECILRGVAPGSTGSALSLVNQIRTRAYKGDASYNWEAAQLTLTNLLAEKARELSFENWRKQDIIRYDVADGTHYYDGARGGTGRAPAKPADPGTYLRIYPIPLAQHQTNNNLVQNPGYPAF